MVEVRFGGETYRFREPGSVDAAYRTLYRAKLSPNPVMALQAPRALLGWFAADGETSERVERLGPDLADALAFEFLGNLSSRRDDAGGLA